MTPELSKRARPAVARWAHVAILSALYSGLLFGSAPTALAAGNANAKLLLTSLSPTTKNACVRSALRPSDCSGYDSVNNLPLYPSLSYVYALVVQGSQAEGIAGASFGIDYDGAAQSGFDVYSWTLCADAETPDAGWPAARTGNRLTFNGATNCQTTGNGNIGAVAVLGYFYSGAYSPDIVRMTPYPGTGVGSVLNCVGAEDPVYWNPDRCQTFFGAVAFGRAGGINPCGERGSCTPYSCLEGPSTVTVGTVTTYVLPFFGPALTEPVTWTLTGPAEIVGHDAMWTEIQVEATAPGSYTVTPEACYSSFGVTCTNCRTHSVLVEEAVPTIGTTWGRIKVLVR